MVTVPSSVAPSPVPFLDLSGIPGVSLLDRSSPRQAMPLGPFLSLPQGNC